MAKEKVGLFRTVGPGLLLAATGVGAGDLATGAFTGSKLGLAVLWAVVAGAAVKFLLNEGLARWQLATGKTLLEGFFTHFGRFFHWVFFIYLLLWSLFVGSALMSAIGVTGHAILPLFADKTDKILYGLLHSAAAVVLVKIGGYRLFAKVMNVCIAFMFTIVAITAIVLNPSWMETLRGIFLPSIPDLQGEGLEWTVALMGGVGGTVTVLCYGYWIREEGREGAGDLAICRLDLAAGYGMTALFGMGMVIIGNRIGPVGGGGASLIVNLSEAMGGEFGAMGGFMKWAFLLGAWSAIFSSLFGVWQSVPYLFADFWSQTQKRRLQKAALPISPQLLSYRIYLYGLATLPAIGLWASFERAQKYYAVFGALFIPLLAVVLLLLNGDSKRVGRSFRNSFLTSLLLVGVILFFLIAGWFKVRAGFF